MCVCVHAYLKLRRVNFNRIISVCTCRTIRSQYSVRTSTLTPFDYSALENLVSITVCEGLFASSQVCNGNCDWPMSNGRQIQNDYPAERLNYTLLV